MIPLLFLALLLSAGDAGVVNGNSPLLNELICALNITFDGTNVPDETPGVNPSYQLSATTIPVVFPLTDPLLANTYYVQIDTTTVFVTAYQADHVTQAGSTLAWADLLTGSAIAVQPSKFTGCAVQGCDGFTLATVPFLALWNNTAIYFVISANLNFYGNSTTAAVVPSSGAFWTLGVQTQTAPPSGAVLIGSVPTTVNLTASAAMRSAAFGSTTSSSSLSTGAIVGIAVGSVAGFAIIALLIYCYCSSKGSDYQKTDGRPAGRPQQASFGGGYDQFEGKHSSSLTHRTKVVEMVI